MRRASAILTILPVLGLLAGCMTGAPTYHGPAGTDESAAIVAVGRPVAESYSVSQNNSWIQIVAVDGDSTGPVQWVRVSPGEHQFKVRHHDPYATFYGNRADDLFIFAAAAGGRYRIDGTYCCGFILGQFEVFVIDEATGQQVATRTPAKR